MAYRVGLTGGIGSGKSLVASLLAQWGATVLDADQISRDLVAPGQPLLAAVCDAWGQDLLAPDGSLQRAMLASKVFGSPQELARLNALCHPPIMQEMERRAREATSSVVVLMAPLLLEAGGAQVDETWVMSCSPKVRVQRVMQRDGLDEQAVIARLQGQFDEATRVAAADVVIPNEGTPDDLTLRLRHEWDQLLLRAASRSVPENEGTAQH